MKKILFLLVCFTATMSSIFAQQNAQHSLTGRIVDQDGQAVAFATLRIIDLETQSNGGISNNEGVFNLKIPTGQHKLEISCLGFETLQIDINITGDTDLYEIKMKIASTQIGEVVVKASKPIVYQEVDRLVVKAENLVSVSTNAIDLLKFTPGIHTNDAGNITMFGKDKVMVLINGRPQQMEAVETAAFLKGLKSTEIEQIEVITSPPAKYAAAGNVGMINIVLRKQISDYLGGLVNNSFYYDQIAADDIVANLKYKKGIFSLYSTVSQGLGNHIWESFDTQNFNNQHWKTDKWAKSSNLYSNAQLGFDINTTIIGTLVDTTSFYHLLPIKRLPTHQLFRCPTLCHTTKATNKLNVTCSGTMQIYI